MKMLGYNFEILYKPGNENKAADALARKSETDGEIWAISTMQIMGLEEVEKEILEDEKLRGIV